MTPWGAIIFRVFDICHIKKFTWYDEDLYGINFFFIYRLLSECINQSTNYWINIQIEMKNHQHYIKCVIQFKTYNKDL